MRTLKIFLLVILFLSQIQIEAFAQRLKVHHDDLITYHFSAQGPLYQGENADKTLDNGAYFLADAMNRIIKEGWDEAVYYNFYNIDAWITTMRAEDPAYAGTWSVNKRQVTQDMSCLHVERVTQIRRLRTKDNSLAARKNELRYELAYIDSIKKKIESSEYAKAKIVLVKGEEEIKHINDQGWSVKYCFIFFNAKNKKL